MASAAREGEKEEGFDVVIVCVADEAQVSFWTSVLDSRRGSLLKPSAELHVVPETWNNPKGAGNGLGTLNAVREAARRWRVATSEKHQDLWADAQALGLAETTELFLDFAQGRSIAVYHTAGKGTRLAPLPAAEACNKPGVKLPMLVPSNGGGGFALTQATMLEAVIAQTKPIAASRRDRVCVFWSDQLFFATERLAPRAPAPVEIFARSVVAAGGSGGSALPLSREEWAARGLSSYGLLMSDRNGLDALLLEKPTFDVASAHAEARRPDKVSTSLGCFTVSLPLLRALCAEFSPELDSADGHLDVDPDFWMPMCHPSSSGSGSGGASSSSSHAQRVRALADRFCRDSGGKMLGVSDVGAQACWLDFGTIEKFVQSLLLLTRRHRGNAEEGAEEEGEEAKALRSFFSSFSSEGDDEEGSSSSSSSSFVTARNCRIAGECRATGSVLSGVDADEVDVRDSILINVRARRIVGENLVLYNVADDTEDGLVFPERSDRRVICDAFDEPSGRWLRFQTTSEEEKAGGDGDDLWTRKRVPMSFAAFHERNRGAAPRALASRSSPAVRD